MSRSLRPSNVYVVYREVERKLRQVGFRATVRHVLRGLRETLYHLGSRQTSQSDSFDEQYRTETSGIVPVGALDIPKEQLAHSIRYQAVSVAVCESMLGELPVSHADYVFVDLGSGKGRALMVASRFPFKEIIGVELSPSLHQIARHNLEVFRYEGQRCDRIRLVCQNAASFDMPEGNTVLFMYNPFDAQVMRTVLSHVEASLEERPRKFYIMYANPQERSVLDHAKFLRCMKNSERYVIYENNAEMG